MFNASKMLVRARKYYIPIGRKTLSKKRLRETTDNQDYYRNVYLRSNHWKILRKKKLMINPICEECKHSGHVEPHHLHYKNLYNVEISDLKTLCRRCHTNIHELIDDFITEKLKIEESTIRDREIKLQRKKDLIVKMFVEKIKWKVLLKIGGSYNGITRVSKT